MEAIPALTGKALAAHVKTGSGTSSDLTSLALVIFTLAGEQDTEPQLVSLQDIRSAWADTGEAARDGLLARVRAEVDRAARSNPDVAPRPLGTGIAQMVLEQVSAWAYDRPLLESSSERLLSVLDALADVEGLPDPPAPPGAAAHPRRPRLRGRLRRAPGSLLDVPT